MTRGTLQRGDEVVEVESLRLRVRRIGSGPPLLLINGIGAAIEMWQPFLATMDGRELIAFDLPGAGLSAVPASPLRMRALARITVGLLDALGYEEVDVLGYSFGGLVAQELAHRAGQRVRRLILCATSAGPPGLPPTPLVIGLMLSPARYYDAKVAAAMLPWVAGGRTARDDAALRAGIRQRRIHPPSRLGYAQQLAATIGWTSHPWLHRLGQPTLVLHGDDDPVAPLANARCMARRIPDCRLHVLRDSGHLFLIDEPQEAVGVIQAFLDVTPG